MSTHITHVPFAVALSSNERRASLVISVAINRVLGIVKHWLYQCPQVLTACSFAAHCAAHVHLCARIFASQDFESYGELRAEVGQMLVALERAWQSSVSQQKVAQLLLLAIEEHAQASAARDAGAVFAENLVPIDSAECAPPADADADADADAHADARVLAADEPQEAARAPAPVSSPLPSHAHSGSDPAPAAVAASSSGALSQAGGSQSAPAFEPLGSELSLLLVPSEAPGPSDFDTLSATDMADQMTRLDHAIFCSIQHEYVSTVGVPSPLLSSPPASSRNSHTT